MRGWLVLGALIPGLAGCVAEETLPAWVDGHPAACLQPAPPSWQAYNGTELADLTAGDWRAADRNLTDSVFEALARKLLPWNGTPYDVAEFSLWADDANFTLEANGGLVTRDAPLFYGGLSSDAWRFVATTASDGSVSVVRPPNAFEHFAALPRDTEDFARQASGSTAARAGYSEAANVQWHPDAVLCLQVEYYCPEMVACRGQHETGMRVWVDLDGEVQATESILLYP